MVVTFFCIFIFTNWLRFLIWLGLGLVIYFTYSRMHSKLAVKD